MDVLFLTNSFPTVDYPKRGLFNLRAAENLGGSVNIDIVHLRSWKPFRKFKTRTTSNKLAITTISLPILPSKRRHIWGLQLFFYKRLAFILLKKKLIGCDVIHSVGASFSGIVGSYISKNMKIPHVCQCIGSDVNFTLPKVKDTLGFSGWEKSVDIFTCNSQALAGQVVQLYPEKMTDVIYRGVDLYEFRPSKEKYDRPLPLCFLFLGGLSWRAETGHGRNLKGGVTLLRAWEKAFRDFKGVRKPKLIFGGPEVTHELVNELVTESNCSDLNLEVVGEMTREGAVALMARAHLVIVPSMQEGLPNVAFEAYASGCALIASDVGGIPEIVENRRHGLLCASGNENELADALVYVTLNPRWVIQVGKHNRDTSEVKYDSKRFSLKYFELYQLLQNGLLLSPTAHRSSDSDLSK